MMRTPFGIALPQSIADSPDAGRLTAEFAAEAESHGLHSAWVQEQILGSDPSLEPIVNLAFAAAATERMLLGSAAVIAPVRNPIVLAKQLATLDRLSGGRVIAGLAIGEMPALYEASGVSMAARGSLLDEHIALLRSLWDDAQTDHISARRSLVSARMEPKPLQSRLPVWFGGGSERALRRAARHGEGWIGAGGSTVASFVAASARLRELVPARADFTIAKKVYIGVEPRARLAEERMSAWFEEHWGAAARGADLARSVAIFGTPDDCAQKLRELISTASLDLVILNPVYDEMRQMRELVSAVIPMCENA